jgi:hypothetical protein
MFRAAYRLSSGAPNRICSLWFIYPCVDRSLSENRCAALKKKLGVSISSSALHINIVDTPLNENFYDA